MSLTPQNDAEWIATQVALAQHRESEKGNSHPSQLKIHPAMAALPAQDPYGRIVDLPISESSPLIALIPQALRDIAANLASQDNRITNNPQFLVQKKIRQTGLDLDYCDNFIWLNHAQDCDEVTDPAQIERLEELEAKGYLSSDEDNELADYVKTGYADRWETVQPFFTEVEADRYIAANKHRHDGELRTYVEWGGRNPEWMAVRNFLLSLNPSAPNAPTTPSTTP